MKRYESGKQVSLECQAHLAMAGIPPIPGPMRITVSETRHIPARVGRLRGYGSGIVCPLAEEFIRTVID